MILEAEQKKIRVILDTDANNELDDQHAIAYMLFNSQVFNIEGITINKTVKVSGEVLSFLSTGIDTRVYYIKNF